MTKNILLLLFFTFSSVYKSQTLVRGPYLQQVTPTSIIIKWKTNSNCNTKVTFGTSLSALTSQTVINNSVTNHEIKITGLNSSTIYYYQVGTTTLNFTPANTNQYFKTSPLAGNKGPHRFWVVGDAGTGNSNQQAARNGFLTYNANKHVDGWLWLGDNAYDGGFDSEYQNNVFSNNMYENELKRMVVWPATGNHDYNNHIPFSPSPAYFDIFTLPTAAEAGGVASGTEKYYSYNYGNVHFIVLDSYDVGRNTNDPMALWLQNDLAANTLPWTIAYWHHPPYTKGSHNSDNSNFLDGELVDMRQNIIPILEAGGVDMVLNGHSHCYERSYLINGHYGYSNQLQPSMVLDNTSGNYPSSCPYKKNTTITKANKGTVYVVCGCSGKLSGTSSGWPHPVFYSYTNTVLGSMLIEINDNRLDAKFINSSGSVHDGFTITKNTGKKYTHNVCQGNPLTLKPSWPATVQWFPIGLTQDSLVINPILSTTYYAYDALNCITDTFAINILPPALCTTGLAEISNGSEVLIYPTYLSSSESLHILGNSDFILNKKCVIKVYDISGKELELRTIYTEHNTAEVSFSSEGISNGVYLLLLESNNKRITKKIYLSN